MKELFLPDPNAERGWYAYWCPNAWDFGWNHVEYAREGVQNRWVAIYVGPLMFALRKSSADGQRNQKKPRP